MSSDTQTPRPLHAEQRGFIIPPPVRPFLDHHAAKCRHVFDLGDVFTFNRTCSHVAPQCMGCGTCRQCWLKEQE